VFLIERETEIERVIKRERPREREADGMIKLI